MKVPCEVDRLAGLIPPTLRGKRSGQGRRILVNHLTVSGADAMRCEGGVGEGGDLGKNKNAGRDSTHRLPKYLARRHLLKLRPDPALVKPLASRYPKRVTARQFRDLVDRALEELPRRFRDHLQNIQVIVKSIPGTEAKDQPASHELLGLYVGNPLTEQSATEPPLFPAQIFIYRDNLIRQCGEDEQALVEEIRITVLHEVGHHLGLDDEEMDMLEEGDE